MKRKQSLKSLRALLVTNLIEDYLKGREVKKINYLGSFKGRFIRNSHPCLVMSVVVPPSR